MSESPRATDSANSRSVRLSVEQSADPRVDLAVLRTELALDRTQLAWVRTVFTFITAARWHSVDLHAGLELSETVFPFGRLSILRFPQSHSFHPDADVAVAGIASPTS